MTDDHRLLILDLANTDDTKKMCPWLDKFYLALYASCPTATEKLIKSRTKCNCRVGISIGDLVNRVVPILEQAQVPDKLQKYTALQIIQEMLNSMQELYMLEKVEKR